MGIGEEQFRQQFGSSLSALEANRKGAGAVGNTYVNALLGIAFSYPTGWKIHDLKEIARVREGNLANSHEEELNEVLRALTDDFVPLVAIGAPQLDDPQARFGPHEIAPAISLHLEEILLPEDIPEFALWDHVMTDLANFHAHIEDYRLISHPASISISGTDAVQYAASYTFLNADAVGGCLVRERNIYFYQSPIVFSLKMCDYPERDSRLIYGFEDVVDTIVIR